MVRNGVSAPPEPGLGGARADLIILSLSAFAAVTTEMAPVGLLPAIGHAFGVAESTAGLLVSLYAVLVAALAVPLTLATKRIPGKRLLLAGHGQLHGQQRHLGAGTEPRGPGRRTSARGCDARAVLLCLHRICHPAGASRADRTGAGARLGRRAGRIRSWRTARDGAGKRRRLARRVCRPGRADGRRGSAGRRHAAGCEAAG